MGWGKLYTIVHAEKKYCTRITIGPRAKVPGKKN